MAAAPAAASSHSVAPQRLEASEIAAADAQALAEADEISLHFRSMKMHEKQQGKKGRGRG